jgi:hypothetical protein
VLVSRSAGGYRFRTMLATRLVASLALGAALAVLVPARADAG